jgi:mannose-1-phosphate guanylyltransferase
VLKSFFFSSTVAINRLYLDYYKSQKSDSINLPNGHLIQNQNKFEESSGINIVEPVFIHATAKIGNKSTIGPNVSIEANCVIGEGVRIRESIILPGARLKDNCCIINSIVGWNCLIGEWARVEGSPPLTQMNDDDRITVNGVKKDSITILCKKKIDFFFIPFFKFFCILGGDIHVADEKFIRNCIVLPHKELSRDFHNEIVM